MDAPTSPTGKRLERPILPASLRSSSPLAPFAEHEAQLAAARREQRQIWIVAIVLWGVVMAALYFYTVHELTR